MENVAPQMRFADINLQIRRGDENRRGAGEVGGVAGLRSRGSRNAAEPCGAQPGWPPQRVKPFPVKYIAAIKVLERVFMRVISYLVPAQRQGGFNKTHHTNRCCETIIHSVSRGGSSPAQPRPGSARLSPGVTSKRGVTCLH